MTYFKDLTPYEYLGRHTRVTPEPLNIGWLGGEIPFKKGDTSQEFKEKLLAFCSDELKGCHSIEKLAVVEKKVL